MAALTDIALVPFSSIPKASRAAFSCGNERLDSYFHTLAKQDIKRKVAATFVLARLAGLEVIGFYNLSAAEIDPGELPPKLQKQVPRYPRLPATRIGRLAVDKRFQRQGWGEMLLIDALFRAFENVEVVGAVAVIVDAKEDARDFYLRYGFGEFADTPNKLFMLMPTIQQMVECVRAERIPFLEPMSANP